MIILDALRGFNKGGRVVNVLIAGVTAVLLAVSGDAFAVGGMLKVTPSAMSVWSASPTVALTLSLSASEATKLNSAGFILQWDANVFALDASSLGTLDDNDPHQTAYLTGNDGTEKNDENGRTVRVWAVDDYDAMELRLSDNDTAADKLFGVAGQAYINYTRIGSVSLSGTGSSDMFKITLKMRPGVADGASTIKATVVAVSDDKGSAHTAYAQGTASITIGKQSASGFTLDIDGDGSYMPLSDGLLIIRHMFSFPGDELTKGVVSSSASRSSAIDIAAYLAGGASALDVDGNGSVEPLADGLLIVRYLFSFPDVSLTSGAVGVGATRTTAADISSYLKSLTPAP